MNVSDLGVHVKCVPLYCGSCISTSILLVEGFGPSYTKLVVNQERTFVNLS